MTERPLLKPRSKDFKHSLEIYQNGIRGGWFQKSSSRACTYLVEINLFALSVIMSNIVNVIWGSEEYYSHGPQILENSLKREIVCHFVMEPHLVCKGLSS